MTGKKRVSNQLESFYMSLKSLEEEVNFKSVFLKAYFEEISVPRLKLNVRRCLKLCFIFSWCQVSFQILNPKRKMSSNLLLCIFGFVLVISLYIVTMKADLRFKTLMTILSTVAFISAVVHITDGGSEMSVYNFACFYPLFPFATLIWTVTSMDTRVLLPTYFGFINKSLIGIVARINGHFYHGTSARVQLKLRNVIDTAYRLRLPIEQSINDALWENADYKSLYRSIVYGFIYMMMLSFACIGYVHGINHLRRLSSFMKLSQNVYAKQSIGANEKERMKWVAAIMPSSIIPDYMKFLNTSQAKDSDRKLAVFSRSYDNVSILFADIVGFTSMSSNKTAPQVVMILNDLFNRFDVECVKLNCEKIGTLGDCYYCVSGCPKPCRDHASNCVLMGLKMCTMIVDFNKEYGESVNMRVGVHTGRVNAAVIGKQRFKFDVYSYAVLIANSMESSGMAGRVHISQDTYYEVQNLFTFERGEDFEMCVEKQVGIQGKILATTSIPTYFVVDTGGGVTDMTAALKQRAELEVDYVENTKQSSHSGSNRSSISYPLESASTTNKEIREEKKQEDEEEDLMEWDRKLILALRNDPEKMTELFRRPPIHPMSLEFLSRHSERQFQNQYVQNTKDGLKVLAPHYASLFDGFISVIFNCAYSTGVIIFSTDGLSSERRMTILVLNFIGFTYFFILCVATFSSDGLEMGFWRKINTYRMRNIHAMVACNIPFFVLLCTYKCESLVHFSALKYNQLFYIFAVVSFLPVVTFHSCSSSVHACSTFNKLLILGLLYAFDPQCHLLTFIRGGEQLNIKGRSCPYWANKVECTPCQKLWFSKKWSFNPATMLVEVMSDLLLVSVAVVFISRQNEEIFRLCYFVTKEANVRLKEAEDQSRRAEVLLYNIIPKYVMDQINRKKGGDKVNYAVSVPCVAVTFACISNFFSSYYREDYKGGESALGLLNKIICFFDDALLKPAYKDVEKIKTINDCYVLAAGLNVNEVKDNIDSLEHTYALMDFCFEMLAIMRDFNDTWIIGPERFLLKIGYNFGPVTAGIIGTTKPMFDIWGDTVNVSSRMYSNGTVDSIQCSKDIAKQLRHKFQFRKRGEIFLKGKGMVTTYLALGRVDASARRTAKMYQ